MAIPFTAFSYPVTGGAGLRTDPDRWGDIVSVKEWGAVGDGQEVRDAIVANGSVTLTSATGYFTPSDVGKSIWIVGGAGAGTITRTTIGAYVSANNISLAAPLVAPSPTSGVKILWGTDDTTNILNAIAALAGSEVQPKNTFGKRGRTLFFPDGMYLHSGLTVKARTTMLGRDRSKVYLRLIPNSLGSATNGQSLINTTATDDYITVANLTIDGSRDYQLPTTGVAQHGVNLSLGNTQAPDVDYRHRFQHVIIQNCAGDGFRTTAVSNIPRGETHFLDVGVYNVNAIGMNVQMSNSRFVEVSVGYCGANCWKLNAFACQFVACKGFWGGQIPTGVQADMSNWNVDGWGSIFTSCESAESYASGWYITGGNHQMLGCRSDDSGDIGFQNGAASFAGTRAGFYLDGSLAPRNCKDNNFNNCHIGLALNGAVSFMTHGIFMTGNADFNDGTFYTQQTTDSAAHASTYSVAKMGNSNASGILSNTYTIDELPIAGGDLLTITTQAAAYTFVLTDSNSEIRGTSAGAVTYTLPPTMPVGWTVNVIQDGAGQITFSPGAGASMQSIASRTKTAQQFAQISLLVKTNSTGSNAVYQFSGDTA